MNRHGCHLRPVAPVRAKGRESEDLVRRRALLATPTAVSRFAAPCLRLRTYSASRIGYITGRRLLATSRARLSPEADDVPSALGVHFILHACHVGFPGPE